jgi:mannose-6-phosphate isomerase-like protein (cupin superfamily)
MKNYQAKDVGSLKNLNQYVFAPEGAPIRIEGKLFLNNLLNMSSVEVSLNQNKAGTGMNFFHRHKNHEETYIFIGGKGEMSIDDEIVPVQEGSIVTIQPQAKRSWWNTGDTDLTYIVIQAPVNGMKNPVVADGELMEGTVPWS